MNILLFILFLTSIIYIIYLRSRRLDQLPLLPKIKESKNHNSKVRKKPLHAVEYEENIEETNFEKGYAFEQFVVSKFEKGGPYILETWRSDKEFKGVFPQDSMDPDLVWLYELDVDTALPFAVECKWRSDYYNGGIKWAKPYQWENYMDFQEAHGVPVFIVLGIGGRPDNPDELFIIPLDEIKYPIIFKSVLLKYRCRNPHQILTYNPRSNKLY